MSLANLDVGSLLRVPCKSWAEPPSISVCLCTRSWDLVILLANNLNRIDCQNDLSKSITKLNKKSRLFVLREAPQTLFPKLFKAWRVSHLVFEKDTDAYGRERDEEIMKLAKNAGVEVKAIPGRTLYDSDDLMRANGGKPTMSISQVQSVGYPLLLLRRFT